MKQSGSSGHGVNTERRSPTGWGRAVAGTAVASGAGVTTGAVGAMAGVGIDSSAGLAEGVAGRVGEASPARIAKLAGAPEAAGRGVALASRTPPDGSCHSLKTNTAIMATPRIVSTADVSRHSC
jgi:hypothetical protein